MFSRLQLSMFHYISTNLGKQSFTRNNEKVSTKIIINCVFSNYYTLKFNTLHIYIPLLFHLPNYWTFVTVNCRFRFVLNYKHGYRASRSSIQNLITMFVWMTNRRTWKQQLLNLSTYPTITNYLKSRKQYLN